MANGVDTLAVKRSSTALAPVRQRMTDHFLTSIDHHDGLLRLLVLIPVGSLVMAGLLIIALSRIVGAPSPAPSHSSSRVDAAVQVDLPVSAEIEVP